MAHQVGHRQWASPEWEHKMEETEVLEQETPSVEDTEGATPTGETPEEYEFKYDGKDVKMSSEEFAQFYGDWDNSKKWKAALNDKGRKLNEERSALRAEQHKLGEDKKLVDEYRTLKKAFEANPAAYKQVNQLLNEQKPAIDPAVKEVRDELRQTRSEMEREKAVLELSKKYEDFNYDELNEFIADYDFLNHKDMMEMTYLAKKGSQLPDLLSEARANVVRDAKKKKGLPATGKKEGIPTPKPKTIAEMVEAEHRRLEAQGISR